MEDEQEQAFFEDDVPDGDQSSSYGQAPGHGSLNMMQGFQPGIMPQTSQQKPPITTEFDLSFQLQKINLEAKKDIFAMQNDPINDLLKLKAMNVVSATLRSGNYPYLLKFIIRP
ncbi:MAG: hypothetical protein ABII22_04660 [Candidatus Micrarchaeota archaeon]